MSHSQVPAPRGKRRSKAVTIEQGMDAESLKAGILSHIEFTLGELPHQVDNDWEPYLSVALAVRDLE